MGGGTVRPVLNQGGAGGLDGRSGYFASVGPGYRYRGRGGEIELATESAGARSPPWRRSFSRGPSRIRQSPCPAPALSSPTPCPGQERSVLTSPLSPVTTSGASAPASRGRRSPITTRPTSRSAAGSLASPCGWWSGTESGSWTERCECQRPDASRWCGRAFDTGRGRGRHDAEGGHAGAERYLRLRGSSGVDEDAAR